MSYALLTADKTAVQQYPVSRRQIARLFNIMISNATEITSILEAGRVVPVQPTARPADSAAYEIVEGAPVKSGANWVQVWNTIPLDAGEQTTKLNQAKLLKWKSVVAKGNGLRSGKFAAGPGEFDLSGDGFARIVMMGVAPGARVVPIGQNAQGIERYLNATGPQVAALVAAISNYIDATYARESALRDAIAAANSIAELDAIDVNSGWPSNS